jgi:hypothetical protein
MYVCVGVGTMVCIPDAAVVVVDGGVVVVSFPNRLQQPFVVVFYLLSWLLKLPLL